VKADAIDYEAHRSFFREVIQSIHECMAEHYGLHDIKIKPLGASGSRLSIPIKIEGVDKDGVSVKLFAKILGNSELLTAKTIQLFKNIFLHMNAMVPMFDFNASAEHMAKHQFKLLKAIHDLDIPTARPLGYHKLNGNLWLLVEEFLEAKPISNVSEITEDHLDMAFSYLAKMHKGGIYHGDIKPENIMFAEKVYIMDVGNFLDEAPVEEKKAYDIACQIASFLEYAPPEKIVELALNHYSKKDIKHATEYIELIQRRPDINFSDEVKEELVELMTYPGKKRKVKEKV
jgi:tRNA A-37 threonylcarbamoyl transferase component Bud32